MRGQRWFKPGVNPDPTFSRRQFVTGATAAAAAVAVTRRAAAAAPAVAPSRPSFTQAAGTPIAPGAPLVSRRPPPPERAFVSPAVEARIRQVRAAIANPELGWLFENCYPNTLDTTVAFHGGAGSEDTFIITGDIPAMWLRDSTAQTWVYLPLAGGDENLRQLFRGLIRRQAHCVQLDPYANAFYAGPTLGEWRHDETEMKPGVHERKWEIDSLCYPLRLAYGYWRATHDRTPFDPHWLAAARLTVATFRVQQRLDGTSPYRFARKTTWFYDNSPNRGLGNPSRKTGLIHSAFRPSDDGCFYPYLIPSNFFAAVSLRQLAALLGELGLDPALRADALDLAGTLRRALAAGATVEHPTRGRIYAFEADGYGNAVMMDDANMPSLLSLPYLGACAIDDPVYQRSRAFALSPDNPYFHRGRYGEGIGGPHVAPDMIWPLSIIMRALTSRDDGEIRQCLRTLLATHAGTGFMHESFNPDAPQKFSRPWFAWCNAMFGELVSTLADTKPRLLASV